MVLKVTTWNINSFRLRESLIVKYLQEYLPDVICLQECKSPVEKMPFATFKELGFAYYAARGQKGYNGVAILSKLPIKAEFSEDFANLGHARHIAVVLESGVTVHNFYVPAGGDIPDIETNPKFAHKLQFIDEMTSHFSANQPKAEILVGDLNIAPLASDVWSSKQLLKIISHTPVETDGLKRLIADGGWHDAVRAYFGDDQKLYSWWSYRARDWAASDRGRRLDHIWVSHDLADKVAHAEIHRDWRGVDKPSDHVPISLTL